MTLSGWLTFRFSASVEVQGDLSEAEALANLKRITAPPFSFTKSERRKPLRGFLETTTKTLRWPLNQARFASPRTLYFTINGTASGARLTGELRMRTAYRIIIMLWLYGGITANMIGILLAITKHGEVWTLKFQVLSPFIGAAIAYGYTWLVLAVGRRRERDLIRVLQTTVQNQEQAAATRILLMR